VRAAVTVGNDPTHGMLAVVRITDSADASREAIIKRCSELLGSFQIRHVVELVPGGT
jgi:fatty-acyl-CoA synthase